MGDNTLAISRRINSFCEEDHSHSEGVGISLQQRLIQCLAFKYRVGGELPDAEARGAQGSGEDMQSNTKLCS